MDRSIRRPDDSADDGDHQMAVLWPIIRTVISHDEESSFPLPLPTAIIAGRDRELANKKR